MNLLKKSFVNKLSNKLYLKEKFIEMHSVVA